MTKYLGRERTYNSHIVTNATHGIYAKGVESAKPNWVDMSAGWPNVLLTLEQISKFGRLAENRRFGKLSAGDSTGTGRTGV